MLYFNTVLNKSHEWGTSPWHWYFTSALPKSLLGAALFVPMGVVTWGHEGRPSLDSTILELVGPAIVFVGLYSWLPHKELRFIIHAIPAFNVAAARGLAQIGSLRQMRLNLLAGLILAGSFGCCLLFATASSMNYPGGHGFDTYHRIVRCDDAPCKLHIGVLPAMTGVTR